MLGLGLHFIQLYEKLGLSKSSTTFLIKQPTVSLSSFIPRYWYVSQSKPLFLQMSSVIARLSCHSTADSLRGHQSSQREGSSASHTQCDTVSRFCTVPGWKVQYMRISRKAHLDSQMAKEPFKVFIQLPCLPAWHLNQYQALGYKTKLSKTKTQISVFHFCITDLMDSVLQLMENGVAILLVNRRLATNRNTLFKHHQVIGRLEEHASLLVLMWEAESGVLEALAWYSC